MTTTPLELVSSLARRHVAAPRIRPYGVAVADLDVDFDAARPLVVTRLLARCLGDETDEGVWWSLPVQTRILLVLGLSELSLADAIEVHVACDCGETAVVGLTAAELAEFAAERSGPAPVAVAIEAEGRAARLRLPTGRDQLRWAQLAVAGPRDIARSVLSDLVVEGERPLTDALVAAADRALAEIDPLVEMSVSTACPECGAVLESEVDLERLALTRLRSVRHLLLSQVHALAATYHWSEAQIAELPAWRRAEHVALIEQRRR